MFQPRVLKVVKIRKFMEYNDVERRAFFKAFSNLSWDEFTKNREASFLSIRNIFIHSLNSTNYWLDFIQGKNRSPNRKFEEYTNLKDIEAYMKKTEEGVHDYIQTLSTKELKKKHLIVTSGKPEELRTEDILVHVFEEEVHHRGELIALFWQIGIEPPVIGYPP